MAIKYKTLPPTINFNEPNPELYIDESPFYVNTKLQEWKVEKFPRRAAVSSFGFGGTNAHCILEEWTSNVSQPSEKEMHLLPVSAKSPEALNSIIKNLGEHLKLSKNELADIAFTLQNGRNDFANRAIIYGNDKKIIADNLNNPQQIGLIKGSVNIENPAVVFMFTGQGSQYVNMARGLYESFSLFKNIVDQYKEENS